MNWKKPLTDSVPVSALAETKANIFWRNIPSSYLNKVPQNDVPKKISVAVISSITKYFSLSLCLSGSLH